MTRPEHLKQRVIGSSDAPPIMGVSPWCTKYQLWEQKINPKEMEENDAMRRGNRLEPIARELFESIMDVEVFERALVHPDYPWMTATLDGIDIDNKVMVEIKCTNKKNHNVAKEGNVPDHYYPQLQHQLAVTGLDKMYYFSYVTDPLPEGVMVEVKRDDEYIERLIKEEREFYECVITRTAPELADDDYEVMKSGEWDITAEEYLWNLKELKKYEKKDKELRETLIRLANNRNAVGCYVKVSKSMCKGAIDYSKVPALAGQDLEVYRKPDIIKWRVSPVDIKI